MQKCNCGINRSVLFWKLSYENCLDSLIFSLTSRRVYKIEQVSKRLPCYLRHVASGVNHNLLTWALEQKCFCFFASLPCPVWTQNESAAFSRDQLSNVCKCATFKWCTVIRTISFMKINNVAYVRQPPCWDRLLFPLFIFSLISQFQWKKGLSLCQHRPAEMY